MNGGSTVRVGFSSLEEDAAGSIDTMINNMYGALGDLQISVDATVATWEGDAQSAYYLAKTAWTDAANNIAALLAACKDAVITANEEYQLAEILNKNRFEPGRA